MRFRYVLIAVVVAAGAGAAAALGLSQIGEGTSLTVANCANAWNDPRAAGANIGRDYTRGYSIQRVRVSVAVARGTGNGATCEVKFVLPGGRIMESDSQWHSANIGQEWSELAGPQLFKPTRPKSTNAVALSDGLLLLDMR